MYPKRYSEFEVQAAAYNHLKAAGYNVRGEVRLPPPSIGMTGTRIVVVIEVKRGGKGKLKKQEYYSKLANAPCICLRGMEEAHSIVARIQAVTIP